MKLKIAGLGFIIVGIGYSINNMYINYENTRIRNEKLINSFLSMEVEEFRKNTPAHARIPSRGFII